jgi:conjugative relaxase-like TrwC/TraI family protein
MLRLHVVRAAGTAYYVDDLVPDRPGGSLVAGESPGRWTGAGSAALGLRGTVSREVFLEVCSGRDPVGDRALRVPRGPRAVAGVDLLFSAPKGVSILHLVAPRELAVTAGDAHRSAVADALGYLEREGVGVRRTRGAASHRMAATGAVAAGFVHRTSRARDPHLHTHLVTANVAQGVDGVWSSLDTRRLFAHRRAAGAVYDASLRSELSRTAGVAWERRAGGWDLAGIDPVLARLLSQRSASIEEHTFRRGNGAGAGARRAAFHADRPDKDRTVSMEELRARWRERAADFGIDPSDLVEVVGRAHGTAPGVVDGDLLRARFAARSPARDTVGERDLVAAVAESSPGGIRSHEAERVARALGVRAAARADGGTTLDRIPGGTGRRWGLGDVVGAVRHVGPQAATVDAVDAVPRREADRVTRDGPMPDRIHDVGHPGPVLGDARWR